MQSMDKIAQIAGERGVYCQFFERAFGLEADRAFIEAAQNIDFSDSPNMKLEHGAKMLAAYCKTAGFNVITDLAVDYASVFLGAGVADGGAAYPYESVYTSEGGLVMQDARDEAADAYARHSLATPQGTVEPEDHVSFELGYLATLADRCMEACDSGDAQTVAELLADQEEFLTHHVLAWCPRFCDDILKYAHTDFYRGIAQMFIGYLELEAKRVGK